MIVGLLWFVFVVSAILLGLIILIQEGKGGGLGEAFGGMGAETFGVKASGVNRVTSILAITFLLSAILINKCSFQGPKIFGDATPAEEGGDPDPGAGVPANQTPGGEGQGK